VAADLVLTVMSPFDPDHPAQLITAVLNGQLIGEARAAAGWEDIRFRAPASVWWIGYNELRIVLATTVKPRDVGANDDSRRLSLALSKVAVVARGQ
jgi:hypothetical protein